MWESEREYKNALLRPSDGKWDQSRRRKVFVSYHHADQDEVRSFIERYDHAHDLFITRVVGMSSEIEINSRNVSYVMRRIREDYLRDSTVTIVLIGRETWKRKYVDWEIDASLSTTARQSLPNGLIGIRMNSYFYLATNPPIPDRLYDNIQYGLLPNGKYGRIYDLPGSSWELTQWIEDAYESRTKRAHLIVNVREMMQRNRT